MRENRGIQVFIFVSIMLSLISCQPKPSEPAAAADPTEAPKAANEPTATAAPTKTPTETATALPTPSPTIPVQAASSLSDLKDQGYEMELIYPFGAFFSEDIPEGYPFMFWEVSSGLEARFGGPNVAIPNPMESLSVTGPDGQLYYFMIYKGNNSCQYVFLNDDGKIIYKYNLLTDSPYIRKANQDEDYFFAIDAMAFCMANGWGDHNENGKPDIAATLMWNNNYWKGEMQLFEITESGTVINLFENLPGPVSHWDFWSFGDDILFVMDTDWIKHDCDLYPAVPYSAWLYSWDGKAYSDVTEDADDLVKFLANKYTQWVEEGYGDSFSPHSYLGFMVNTLLIYDKHGEREAGWQKFLEMTDLSNWPGTSEENKAWLEYDIAHFRAAYEAGKPFTPGQYPGTCE